MTITDEIRKGKWNNITTYRAFLNGKPVGMLQAKKYAAERDLQNAKDTAVLAYEIMSTFVGS